MIRWFWRNPKVSTQDPHADGAEEARRAKIEARRRREATLEVLRLREDVVRRNHIADDIGRAYRIIHGKG